MDKLTIVRNWILDLLESGQVPGDGKLPVTREIAAFTGISLLIVQSAVESLSNEGALYKAPRHGVYVHPDWRERVLQRSFFLFDPLYPLPYLGELQRHFRRDFPQLRVVEGFRRGMFEIRTTGYLQAHHEEYLDLAEVFQKVFTDGGDFLFSPFEACRLNGRLVGLPLIFSPRVMYYNPVLLAKAGIPEPGPRWSWQEYTRAIRAIAPGMPPEKRRFWIGDPHCWMNYLLRAGGSLIDTAVQDPVRIDSPATRRSLLLFRNFLRENEIPSSPAGQDFTAPFLAGELPFLMAPRELLSVLESKGFSDWRVTALPLFPDGVDTTVQATDIFCVRRECADKHLIPELVGLLFGKTFQNYLADIRYGVPIRKSASRRSLKPENAADRLFRQEIPGMTVRYNLYDRTLFELMTTGVNRIITGNGNIAEETAELGHMTRTFLKLSPPNAAGFRPASNMYWSKPLNYNWE